MIWTYAGAGEVLAAGDGGLTTLQVRDGIAVMATSGLGDSAEGNSVGWRFETPPLPTDRLSELRLTLKGVGGAKYYVDVLDGEAILSTSGWRVSPTEVETVVLQLPPSCQVTAIMLYTLSAADGRVENHIQAVVFGPKTQGED